MTAKKLFIHENLSELIKNAVFEVSLAWYIKDAPI
jgi:hypothetical protein